MAKKETKMSKKIMKDIQSDELQMHSRAYFKMLNLALVAVSGLFLMISSLIILIAFRDIKYGESLGLRAYGTRGYSEFFQTLPWLAIFLGLLAFLIAYTLIKHFNFTYKHRLHTVIGALVFAVVGLGIVFASTGVEGTISRTGPFENLRTFNRFSREHSVAGEIVGLEANKLTIFTKEGETVNVRFTNNARSRYSTFKVGEVVFVMGNKQNDGSFEAYGIRRGEMPPPPHAKGMRERFMK